MRPCCAVFQGDSMRTNIQLDFGDGTAVSYSNLSWTEEGIKHVYKSAGIFRVTALAENTLGYDTTTLFLHVTCEYCYFQGKTPITRSFSYMFLLKWKCLSTSLLLFEVYFVIKVSLRSVLLLSCHNGLGKQIIMFCHFF